MKDNFDDRVCTPYPQILHLLHLLPHPDLHPFLNLVLPQQLTENQNTESSPQSSLPCGQRTPAGSTSTSDTPSPHTPPQPFVHSQQQPQIPTPTHHTSPKPHKPQDIQHSPVKTNVNPPTQPPISDEEQEHLPKSTNGSQVKRVNNSRGSKRNAFVSTATSRVT